MARRNERIFPNFEEVRRITASLSNDQLGNAMRVAWDLYFDGATSREVSPMDRLVADMLLEQAARYDKFREKQRTNALGPNKKDQPSAANSSQSQPSAAKHSEVQPSDPPSPSPYPSISNICSFAVQLLNELTGSSYRTTTKKTQTVISARVREGFTQSDFEVVIRHKCKQWLNDEKMREYLRPETLFGPKFEGYLNDARRSAPKEQVVVLAPLEDPFEAEMAAKGGGVDD